MMRLISVCLIAVAAALCGCRGEAQQASPACERQEFDGSKFTVCTFEAARDKLLLTDQYRRLTTLERALGSKAGEVRFAMNAGMYDASGKAVGLYVEAGKEMHPANTADGPGNFHMKPNGVFWIESGGAHVSTTDDYLAGNHTPDWATQSGPMLVIGGKLHPSIQDDGPSRFVRNGVGVRNPSTAVFVISDEPVSFGRLARLFRDGLDCKDALYLDGAVSSLWDPATGRLDSAFDLGPIVVVSDAD